MAEQASDAEVGKYSPKFGARPEDDVVECSGKEDYGKVDKQEGKQPMDGESEHVDKEFGQREEFELEDIVASRW